MKNIGLSIIQRPDDIVTQFKYYLSLKGQKNNLPNILKRTWAEKISKFSAYQLKKYLNTGLVDIVRICHANSDTINEMMKTGNIQTKDEEKTWEVLRSGGKSWEEIISQIDIPHMALLRNLRGMSDELSKEQIVQMCNKLLDGVERGKQYPYRYYTAYSMMDDVNHDDILKYNLSKCVNKSMMHFPKLKGKTISLCDNSGSASGAFNSTYGKTTVSTIANLSGIMTAINSDEGYVGIFGNELFMFYIDKQECILQQLDRLENKSEDINGGTEHGIWLFFDQAIKEKVHYDNIFIYSDMQAGHGGLYGDHKEYKEYIVNDNYIDVLKLVEKYRNVVNPKVNLFTVQVAGYDNNVLPEHIYRGAVLSGWTGNEVKYANYLIKLWDQEDLLVKSNQ
jgi:hypothetical protein